VPQLRHPFFLLAVSILFNVAGQLLLKRAAMAGSGAGAAITRSFISPWFVLGVGSLGTSMLLWVQVLRKMPISLAHPITGIVFVLVPLASHFLWAESLPPTRLLGIAVIVFGVFLVARGG
jgi:undecaprenyl phosphate-alpha-L-ara4N flippase subunit ArnE